MFRNTFYGISAATMISALIYSPATAFADCGDPDQPPCTGPVLTVDHVVALMAELTDPDIPTANKSGIDFMPVVWAMFQSGQRHLPGRNQLRLTHLDCGADAVVEVRCTKRHPAPPE